MQSRIEYLWITFLSDTKTSITQGQDRLIDCGECPVITEVRGEGPALKGGDESDKQWYKPPTIARPDIPTDT